MPQGHPWKQLGAELKGVGAVLKRRNRHLVFGLPNGKILVTPATPSDSRHGEKNAILTLRRLIKTT